MIKYVTSHMRAGAYSLAEVELLDKGPLQWEVLSSRNLIGGISLSRRLKKGSKPIHDTMKAAVEHLLTQAKIDLDETNKTVHLIEERIKFFEAALGL